MSDKLTTNAPSGEMTFCHSPGSEEPLVLQYAPTMTEHLVGWVLQDSWNRDPVELLEAVANRTSIAGEGEPWTLEHHRGKNCWRLDVKDLSASLPDESFRRLVLELAQQCLAGLARFPSTTGAEILALERRIEQIQRR